MSQSLDIPTRPDETWLDDLCQAVSGAVMTGHLREFARWVKLSGTKEELASLNYVRARLEEYGLRTTLVMHPAYISLPGAAQVSIDGVAVTAITHSHAKAGEVSGRVVYVGAGRAADFAAAGDVAGCVVLADGIANPAVARLASRAGAVGQLHVSPHHHLHEMCVSPVWGSPSGETIGEMPSTVICTISHADGTALAARVMAGEAPVVVLRAAVDTGWRPTPILVGELDGPLSDGTGADGPFVLFSGHHDTWFYGVMDNGSANATMLESVRLMAQAPGRVRGLRVCFWSGHSHGRYSGSTWYVDEHWDELDRRCVAHVNVDSTGGMGASVLEDAAAMSELGALAGEAIRLRTGHPYVGKRKNRSSDDSLPGLGVPSMFGALSEQPPGPVAMRNALGWWWHTPEDLIDKVDIDFLVRDTKVFVHVLGRLLTDAVLPLDYAAHARALLAELEGLAASLGGRFAVDGLIAAARGLEAGADALVGAAPAAANAALMACSRALVPLDYSTGDRFSHDPALPLPPWPVLQPLRDLAAAAPGSDAAAFAAVGARRACNRMAHALRQANAALAAAIS